MSRMTETGVVTWETVQKMSDLEIRDTSSLLIIAGSETTATALSGATYLLSSRPEILAKLQEEVRTSFKSEEEITLISVQKLKYMLAVLDETLRLYPPVPNAIARKTPPTGNTICGEYIPPDVSRLALFVFIVCWESWY